MPLSIVFMMLFSSSTVIARPITIQQLMKCVFTNATHASTQAFTGQMSSDVSQGELQGIRMGSAGSEAAKDVGAATSYGIGQLSSMEVAMGVGAASAKNSDATSKYVSQNAEQPPGDQPFRNKRSDTKAVTSLNQVNGDGSVGVLGSTGVSAGPVATSISLGALLVAVDDYTNAVNAGAMAAHAGQSDLTNSFSNTDLYTSSEYYDSSSYYDSDSKEYY